MSTVKQTDLKPTLLFQLVHDFTDRHKTTSLYAYLDTTPDASIIEIAQRLEARFHWATMNLDHAARQHEARWLLINRDILVRALLDEPAQYQEEVRSMAREALAVCPPSDASRLGALLDNLDFSARTDGLPPMLAGAEVVDPVFPDPLQPRDAPTPELPDQATEASRSAPGSTVRGARVDRARQRLKDAAMPILFVVLTPIVTMLFGVPWLATFLQPAPEPVSQLTVSARPAVGTIYIDDMPRGLNGEASFADTLPEDTPLRVRIEADGFESWERTITLADGEQLQLHPKLRLADPMDYRPTSSDTRGEVPAGLKAQISARESAFDTCLSRLPLGAGDMTISGYITTMGVVGRVDFSAAVPPEVQHCMRRQLRAIQLPVQLHDYARFEHTFEIPQPEALSAAF